MLIRRATEDQTSHPWQWDDWLLCSFLSGLICIVLVICVTSSRKGAQKAKAPPTAARTQSPPNTVELRLLSSSGGRTTTRPSGEGAAGISAPALSSSAARTAMATSSRVPEQNDAPPGYELTTVQPAVIKSKRNDVGDMV